VAFIAIFLVAGSNGKEPEVDGFPGKFSVNLKSSAFKLPIGMTWIDNERVLILEKKGTVYIAKPNQPGFPKRVYMTIPEQYLYVASVCCVLRLC
jgi:hypothetical protein